MEDLPMQGELGVLRKVFQAVRRPMVLPALCGRLPWADTGGLFHALANALFFYDLHVAEAILAVVVRHRDALLQGLSVVADLEALLSLATFAWEQPDKCFPQMVGTPGIWISAGRHPLIPPERAVPNDVRLSPASRLWVISGSNMAGKSTLLRVAGVNALLAQIGTIATAGEMVQRPVRLVTDLQARDSLPDQESYFLAEVRHVRRMVLPPEDAEPVLGLIDEPFRGTNSDERVAASLAVVQHLLRSTNFFLVATHEQRLTELVNGTTGRNYHFRENLSEEGLVFDYRLRPGPARTRNALRVLEREGYPQEIVNRARDWTGHDDQNRTRQP
jgi:DNA mismatch repair ATPase MutS